jgi:hypothetical protein
LSTEFWKHDYTSKYGIDSEVDEEVENCTDPEKKREILRDKIIEQIKTYVLNTPDTQNKDILREIHEKARIELLLRHREFLIKKGEKIIDEYFANGSDIVPEKISPKLIPVRTKEEWDIFKTARFTWSLPFSSGYGRRLCFLIMDEYNGKLIGILGAHSPAIGITLRNEWLNLKGKDKIRKLNETMDIFTLGAVPPYNMLLGGKLVAMSAVANEVRDFYREKYSNKKTAIEQNIISPHLVLFTTTSAYGRSSIYNRVKYKDKLLCFSLGYTEGFGVFQYTDRMSKLIKEYLSLKGIEVKSGYGNGPNYKFRLINTAIKEINKEVDLRKVLNIQSTQQLLKHKVKREVFVFPLASNVIEYINGIDKEVKYYDYKFEELAEYWKERYLKQRVKTNDEWKYWNKDNLKNYLLIK